MGEVTREAFTVSNIHTSTHHLMLKPLFYAAGHIHARMQVTSALCYAAGHIHARMQATSTLCHAAGHIHTRMQATYILCYAAGHIHARTHHFKKLTHTYTHTQPLFYAAGHNR